MKQSLLIFLISFFASLVYSQDGAVNTNSGATDANLDYILGERDPFSPPKYIRELEFERTKGQSNDKVVRPEDIIDNQMEAIRRWPLSDYKLVAVIWDVKNPKAMILDKANTMHLLKKNYRIGHREGVITEINESEIVVLQKGTPIVIQIQRTRGGGRTSPEVSSRQNQDPSKNLDPSKNQAQSQDQSQNQVQNKNLDTNPNLNKGSK